jgi:hypothetical protein
MGKVLAWPGVDYEKRLAALENERKQNADLRKQIEDLASTSNNGLENGSGKPIARPCGTAGMNFSIQEAMGLAGSMQKYETYKGLQVS